MSIHSSKSAIKNQKKSAKRRFSNRTAKSRVKTQIRSFLEAVEKKDKPLAEAEFNKIQKILDTVSRKGILHRNTAARKKSRMHHLLNTIAK